MLDSDEKKNLDEDSRFAPHPKKKGDREKFDDLTRQGFTPEEVAEMENNAYNGAIDDAQAKSSQNEIRGLSAQVGKDFFKEEGKITIQGRGRSGGRGKYYFAGALLTFLVVTGAGILFFLPTLALKNLMANVNEKFMDRVEYATQTMTDKYVEKYFKNVVGASLRSCGTHISANCRGSVALTGTAATVTLFNGWRDARLEDKIAKKYGYSFEVDTRSPDTIQIFKKNSFGGKDRVGDIGNNSATREIARLMRTETRAPGIRDRHLIRSLLSRKYGANKWCFIACEKRDAFNEWETSAIRKLKLKIIANIVLPRNEKAATYLMCFVVSCNDRDKLAEDASKKILQSVDSEVLEKISTEIGDKTISRYLSEKALEAVLKPMMGQAASQTASSAIPIIGQIYLAATIADMVDRVDTAIKNRELSQYAQKINEAQYAQYYGLWNSLSDDVQSGEASGEDVGAAMDIIGNYSDSRVWQQMTGAPELGVVQCNNVTLSEQTDPLACPEKSVSKTLAFEEWRNSEMGDVIVGTLLPYGQCIGGEIFGHCPQGSPKTYIRPILGAINWTLGEISGILLGALEHLPIIGGAISGIQDFIGDRFSQLMNYLMGKAFPSVINGDAQNGEVLDQIAAGADVTANAFTKGEVTEDNEFIGLGGQYITPEQDDALNDAIQKRVAEERQSQGIFEKYFDLDNHTSLASTAILNFASSHPNMSSSMTSFINPLNWLGGGITNTFTKKASAASLENRESIFNVKQYAYTVNDPVFEMDPDQLTDEVCAQYKTSREATSYIDEVTGERVYTQTDPCMLRDTVVIEMTKIYNLDTESPDTGSPTPSQPGEINCDTVTGNEKIVCAAQNYLGIRYSNGDSKWAREWGVDSTNGLIGGNDAEAWLARRVIGSNNDFIDCSGFTNLSVYAAFGVKIKAGCSGSWVSGGDPANLREIGLNEIRPGDFLTISRNCNAAGTPGHIAIYVGPGENGKIRTIESSAGRNVNGEKVSGFYERDLNYFRYAARYIGPGSTP